MVDARAARRVVAVLAAACLVAVFTAPRAGADPAAGPVVGPEHPVSDPIESPSGGTVSDIAFDGTNYLVVWTDYRNWPSGGSDIYGIRVTPQGVLLDPGAIPIGTAPGDESYPSVTFGGGNFLVVWSSHVRGGTADIHGARVTPAGTVLDPSPIVISTAPGHQLETDVAYGDGTFVAVWTDRRTATSFDIYGGRVTPSGSVLDGSGVAISSTPQDEYQPAVAFGGGSFLVAWADHRADPGAADVFGARVDPVGAVLDPAGIAIATGPGAQRSPDLAFNGTHHLVAWHEELPSASQVLASRVAPTGVVVAPAPVPVSPPVEGTVSDPAVAALGPTFLVAWQAVGPGGPFDALGARIGADGTNLDPSPVVISQATGTFGGIRVATGTSAYFAAWDDERVGRFQIFGTAVGADGVPSGPGTLLTRSANQQQESAIAFDGTNHLVVWSDNRSGVRNEIVAARVTPAGRTLDSVEIAVSGGASGSSPAVVYDGDFVVVWRDVNSLNLARVSPSGGHVGPPIVLPGPPDGQSLVGFALTTSHLGVLVTWTDISRGGSFVRAVRVDRDGTILDPVPIVIGSGSSSSVASDGQNFLVAWSRSGMDVTVTRLAADGTVLDPTGIQVTAGAHPLSTAVAWNGQRYLVVWGRTLVGGDSDIDAARVTAGGVVQDAVPIDVASGPLHPDDPVLTAGNGPFLVAWRQTGDGSTSDIRGARVADDGAVLDSPGFAVPTSGQPAFDVALSPGPGGTWGMSYTRFVPEPPFGADRVFLRNIAPK